MKTKKNKCAKTLGVLGGMLVMVLALGLALVGCATDGGKTPVVNGGEASGEHPDGDGIIGGLVWKKEYFYSTEVKPWISQDNNSLLLVFTETQLKLRYDSNGDGDFEDAGEYTYTYTLTNFEGKDWKGGDNEEGDYDRRIIVNNETKTGSGTNADLSNRTEFGVSPNLGDDGKIDGKICLYVGVWPNGTEIWFYKPRT
jgi:hypothetical protein